MPATTPTCTWTDAGWITPEADGSRPCPKDHCGLRGKPCGHHVSHGAGIYTCPACIGRTRKDLATIKSLCAIDLVAEALEAGINSEAANLIGPASLGFAGRQETEAEQREADDWRRGLCSYPRTMPEARAMHPLRVLGDLDLALRETYGPETTLRVTVDRAADFLIGLLAGAFPHEDQFEDSAREIARLRAHLEAVAHTARHQERGHPCPRCAAGATEQGLGGAQESDEGQDATDVIRGPQSAPRLMKRYATGSGIDVTAGKLDTWHCPSDTAHWWTDADYREQIEAMTRASVKEGKWLTAVEVAEHYPVSVHAVRKWGQRGRVHTRYVGEALRYSTEDVRVMLANKGDVG